MENLTPSEPIPNTVVENVTEKDNQGPKKFLVFSNKKLLITFFVLVVVLATSLFVIFKYNDKQAKNAQMRATFEAASLETKMTTYEGVLPPGFPASIPVTSSSSLTQSYSKEYSNKMYQTSIVSTSSKTVYENFSYYEEFLRTDGWKIITSQKDENKSILFGTKENDHLEVIIRRNKFGITYVIINVFKAPK